MTSDAPEPLPGPGEVVIDVAAADVLWVETAIRHGDVDEYFDLTPPYVPGFGVAGRVGAPGDGVDQGWSGREVAAHTGQRGGYAERVVVPADRLLAVPDGLARGARVVALARDEHKLARIREFGADAVIDSDVPRWVSHARAALGGAGPDVVLDNVGGALVEAAFAAIAPGGRFSAHGAPSGRFAAIDPTEAERRGVDGLVAADGARARQLEQC